jgi:hypothetical protein
MGTWGTDPFDNDMADELLMELEPLSAEQRLLAVERILRQPLDATAARAGGDPAEGSAFDVNVVVAAAAVVAANVPAGAALAWSNDDDPGIAGWLSRPVPPAVRDAAARALEAALPPESWYWTSWGEDGDRRRAQEVMDELLHVLRAP